jgi:squalene cyclase
MGWSKDHPVLVKAREWMLANGGVVECNTFTKIYLCALGQYEYDAVPAIPPEIVLFPNWFYFNIYEISSWSRGILVPLSIIYAKKPFKKLRRSRASMSSLSADARTPICICVGQEAPNWLAELLPVHRSHDHWAERCISVRCARLR